MPRVLVIGDAILDASRRLRLVRPDPETGTPIYVADEWHASLGGAANVARQCQLLGADVALLADAPALGDVASLTDLPPIHTLRANRRWPRRVRLQREDSAVMLRYDADPPTPTEAEHEAVLPHIMATLGHALNEGRSVAISDYGLGALSDDAIRGIIRECRRRSAIVVADASFRRPLDVYQHAGALVVNARLARDHSAATLRDQLHAEWVVITRGKAGAEAAGPKVPRIDVPAYPAPAGGDAVGCGDAFVAELTTALAGGDAIREALARASAAGAVCAGQRGCGDVTRAKVDALLEAGECEAKESIYHAVRAARRQGKRVVFTSGVFDGLHPGHICALTEAATLGEMLVVVLDDDNRTRTRKGDGRPLYDASMRLALLHATGLASSLLVIQDGHDPVELIEILQPDIVYRGGTTPMAALAAERAAVAKYGGQLVIGQRFGAISTTAIAQLLRAGATP